MICQIESANLREMSKQRFKITKFTNPSGNQVYRVSGTLNGERIRRNYTTRAEAVGARQKLEIRALNEHEDGRTIWTTLSHEQNRDAIAAFSLLRQANSTKTLTSAVEFFLRNYRDAGDSKRLSQVVHEYLDVRSTEQARGIISVRQYASIRRELEALKRDLGDPAVSEIQASDLSEYLGQKTTSLKTWNNRRGYLSTFFKFCLGRKYIVSDPVEEVPKYRTKTNRGTAETLTHQEAAELMKFVETYQGHTKRQNTKGKPGCMVPYFALALFGGIRPDWDNGEITRIRPEHVNLETQVILIEPHVSKVHEKRTIRIQPNLRLWLERYPLNEFPILPPYGFRKMLIYIRKKFELGHDVLRHTYISMLVGAFRSIGDAALQAGNSEAIIRKHYLDLKTQEEADKFWRIVPAGTTLPDTYTKKDGRYEFDDN